MILFAYFDIGGVVISRQKPHLSGGVGFYKMVI